MVNKFVHVVLDGLNLPRWNKMTKNEKIDNFLDELTKLSIKYEIGIVGKSMSLEMLMEGFPDHAKYELLARRYTITNRNELRFDCAIADDEVNDLIAKGHK